MKPPRVVLDTNCLVSALLFSGGRLAVLRQAWQAGRCIPLLCTQSVAELIRVLAYPKFRLEKEEIHTLLAEILPFAETVTLAGTQSEIAELRDPADAVFLHLALQAEADLLVSGDAHLLELKGIAGVRIVSPAEFVSLLTD